MKTWKAIAPDQDTARAVVVRINDKANALVASYRRIPGPVSCDTNQDTYRIEAPADAISLADFTAACGDDVYRSA